MHQRARQQVLISFMNEQDVDHYESMFDTGIIFPGTNAKVEAKRLDVKTVVAKLVGAPYWVEEVEIRALFDRYG